MRDYRRSRFVLVFLLVAVLAVSLYLIIRAALPPVFYISLAAVVALLLILVVWHSRVTAYKRPDCERQFKISAWVDFFSPHYPDRKLLKCPNCGTVSWCEQIQRRT